MIKNRISIFLAIFLIVGFFFLSIPEKGYSGVLMLPGCCIGPNGDCVNFGEGSVACQIDSIVDDGICSREGEGGICSNVIPRSTSIPTLSEWGFIAMAGVLGIIGYLVVRRRKAAA